MKKLLLLSIAMLSIASVNASQLKNIEAQKYAEGAILQMIIQKMKDAAREEIDLIGNALPASSKTMLKMVIDTTLNGPSLRKLEKTLLGSKPKTLNHNKVPLRHVRKGLYHPLGIIAK